MVYQDCYAEFNGRALRLGNASIEASFELCDGMPYCRAVQNKKSGYEWKNERGVVFCGVPSFSFASAQISCTHGFSDNDGLSEPYLETLLSFTANGASVCLRLSLFPTLPFIKSELLLDGVFGGKGEETLCGLGSDGNENKRKAGAFPDTAHIAAVGYSEKHIKYERVSFFDVTDTCDNLIEENSGKIYPTANQKLTGDLFLLDAYLQKEGLLLLKEAPTQGARLGDKDYDLLLANDGCLYLAGCGLSFEKEFEITADTPLYSAVIGVGEKDSLLPCFKKYYLAGATAIKNEKQYLTSNTWGDRSRDTALCESFILRELALAKKLGIDVFQIDDGWQKGITANSGLAANGTELGLGIYDADRDFWTPRLDRFPNGLTPISEKAREYGIALGLWYSCDGADDYANRQTDADTLLSLYKEYGVTYFKLDGNRLDTVKGTKNLTALLRRVYRESGGKIHFHLDITAGRRHGYFFQREFGNLFVENRYTDWGNYYPHNTLKNLWRLCRYIPAQKLQLEFLNPRRNESVYANDPLAPARYEMDYLFATVMFSNPLCWMELTGLPEADAKRVSPIVSIFREIAPLLTKTVVEPIGQMPDGTSFTGLLAKGDAYGYILLFRELTEQKEYTYSLPLGAFDARVLYQSDKASVLTLDGGVKLTAETARSFVLLEYKNREETE